MSDLVARVNDANPNPRLACVLALDTSSSMSACEGGQSPIDELNDGFELFCNEISTDEVACKRVEIAVITFGSTAQVALDFREARDLQPQRFTANGLTVMGAALDLAADELTRQKQAYRSADLNYFRPWFFVITDGQPTDGPAFELAAQRICEIEAANGVNVFAIGVGGGADFAQLAKLSKVRAPLRLKGLSFKEFFLWLSASMATASRSKEPSRDASGNTTSSEQVSLPAVGWGEVAS
jgi:uncharacterized protein YegL